MADLVPIRRALLSVSDKRGLVPFARALAGRGVRLISTGGTARALREAGIDITPVDAVTGFPEIMDGRVKTLHPRVHGGILARRDNPAHAQQMAEHDIEPIDLLCINLYPFERTVARAGVEFDDAIEQIDIGGPCMVRAGAKNHGFVTVVTNPDQYDRVIAELDDHGGATTAALRREFALAAFTRTAHYDAAISAWLTARLQSETEAAFPAAFALHATRAAALRYGENPHQAAAVYEVEESLGPSLVTAPQLHGKPLSYNNLADADAALALVHALHALDNTRAAACVVKHTNPCGAAVAGDPAAAVSAAIAGDPLAAFGGILALSRPVDDHAAERICADDAFFEVVIAPAYEPDALERLRQRWKYVRLLEVGALSSSLQRGLQLRPISGGLLLQERDVEPPHPDAWEHRAGPPAGASDLSAAAAIEVVCRSLTSNAIAIGGAEGPAIRLFGAGAGQMDRVAACRLAAAKAGEAARGAIAISDAFFPFSDGPQVLIDAGVRIIVHPGGSKRDAETFDLCERSGVTCLTTGIRRFRH